MNLIDSARPSWPTSAGVSALAVGCSAEAHTLGRPEVTVRIRISPTFAFGARESLTSKINYLGTTSYLADGTAVSALNDPTSAVARQHLVQLDKATGGNARGIPPRGTPV